MRLTLTWVFNVFMSLILIMNPVSLLPTFIRLTDTVDSYEKHIIIRRACIVGGVVLSICALCGNKFFRLLNVPTCALKIFGGLLLLLTSIEMMVVRSTKINDAIAAEKREAVRKTDISVFPVAIPLIAGPGSCASILVLTESADLYQYLIIFASLYIVLFIIYVALHYAVEIQNKIGIIATHALVRVCGIVLGGIATTSILVGIEDFLLSRMSSI